MRVVEKLCAVKSLCLIIVETNIVFNKNIEILK